MIGTRLAVGEKTGILIADKRGPAVGEAPA